MVKRTGQSRIEIASPSETEQFAGRPADGDPSTASANDSEAQAATPPAADDWQQKYLRATADFQNLQRRSAEESRNTVKYANAAFAGSLLDVIDDFERTLEAGNEVGTEDALLDGVTLIYDKLLTVLKNHSVSEIKALGEPFDPNVHEAMMEQHSAEYEPGTVTQVIQKGYRLHDRVLRPARVIIAKSAAPGEDPHTEGQA